MTPTPKEETEDNTVKPTEAPTPVPQYSRIKVNEEKTHQTWESFGASGAWWSQYVGGWDKPYRDEEVPVREVLAKLLYDKEEGIGLTSYRYNLGAGSMDSGKGTFWDKWRRAESFETAPGVYDFTKDANAVWFLKEVTKLAGDELDVVLFCNSPIERLTVNGMAHMTENGPKSNINPENYDDFAKYVYDVAEHFVAEGIPVTEISPINEPQWDWYNGQEGCHYEPQQVADVLEVFVEEIGKRSETLPGIKVSAPESGEWGGRTKEYVDAILTRPELKEYFDTIDCHSYWTKKSTKEEFARWFNTRYPGKKLRTSEWCEMVNGYDYTMDSAFVMADVIYDDLTELDVVSWQLWVALAPGNYHDGLIYINQGNHEYKPAKRLWGYGNFSKFIRPGFVRVDAECPYLDIYNMKTVAFTGTNDEDREQLVLVMINREDEKNIQLALSETGKYTEYEVYTTNEELDLEMTANGEYTEDQAFTVQGESIVTIVLTK